MILQNKLPWFTIQVTSSRLQGYKLRDLQTDFSVRLNTSAHQHDKFRSLTRAYEPVTRVCKLVTRGFEPIS